MATRVLIIDDDPDIRDVINITLSKDGYECFEASNGEEGLSAIQSKSPNLVLVDYQMPKMNGPEVCRQVKKDILLRHLPIIMVTGKGEMTDKIEGIDSGADDYIVKPFEPKELLARIRMVLRRTKIDQESNPLTRLPGNIPIVSELTRRIENNTPLAVCYADLNNFKSYNDTYGFENGDNVIRETARVLIRATQDAGCLDVFIGHIGGDDFVIITVPSMADKICEKIIEYFDAIAPAFYNQTDRAQGYIVAKDRQDVERHIPIMGISIGVVANEHRKIESPVQVGEIGAELKHYAKKSNKSNYVKDQRKDF
ncbi:MAG: response regulator [Candidatus Omnitrophota bacterium]|nr:response regulator [Candidatus Omnitrophota bacterium]